MTGCTLNEETANKDVTNENAVSESNFIDAEVTRVVDGDTMKILVDGKEETVRLLLVDTPETVHPNKEVQPFGPETSQFAKEMLNGKKVQIELDVSERDKYGRLLVYLHIDGKMFNKLLLEKGLARVAYIYAPNTKYVDEFYEIQKKAQQNEQGIWSIENYVTEDKGYNEQISEKASSEHKKQSCTIKGNISSKGEKIYHTDSSPWYEKTKPEEMFCTEKEAAAAGYRPAKR
ncbi:thermonuclease family protein [Metabacillus fastidiosus]|uniref:thermonuclease family protein n=1 Tax=Metabacillus fastidiosus TaxID=1458 RepID=UPI002DB9E84D|nr:thermonuclease family protein [Metabacillus fastidiosus]MEC2078058.1 thermonuclease family protein [Metabacillus fastidiosus]